jgi:hypothetical protein
MKSKEQFFLVFASHIRIPHFQQASIYLPHAHYRRFTTALVEFRSEIGGTFQ